MQTTMTEEIEELHSGSVWEGNRVQVINWPVRVWITKFRVTKDLDEETGEWKVVHKKQLSFRSVFIAEHEQADWPELNFTVVDPEWIKREKELLRG